MSVCLQLQMWNMRVFLTNGWNIWYHPVVFDINILYSIKLTNREKWHIVQIWNSVPRIRLYTLYIPFILNISVGFIQTSQAVSSPHLINNNNYLYYDISEDPHALCWLQILFVNIKSHIDLGQLWLGQWLFFDGTNPLHEAMSTYYQRRSVVYCLCLHKDTKHHIHK